MHLRPFIENLAGFEGWGSTRETYQKGQLTGNWTVALLASHGIKYRQHMARTVCSHHPCLPPSNTPGSGSWHEVSTPHLCNDLRSEAKVHSVGLPVCRRPDL